VRAVTRTATDSNVVGLVSVAAFATDEGERLNDAESTVLFSHLRTVELT
jgi:hypothetical protein